MGLHTLRAALALGTVLLSTSASADEGDDGVKFSDFTPLPSSAGVAADEASPITLSNPAFTQLSIIDRSGLLAAGIPNSGNNDMNTVNTSAPKGEDWDRGRYLFTVFETNQGGVQRHDLDTGETETVWFAPTVNTHVAFDASFWTPWGTFVTAEESWAAVPVVGTPFGRLFELKNALGAPGIVNPVTAASNANADFVHRNIIPRVSHEGLQFDKSGSMYFIDELNGGCLYKYTPESKIQDVINGKADYFANGTTYVLRVGDGLTPNATGTYKWIAITDSKGKALPGGVTITDVNGVTSVDGRATTDLLAFKGTDYQRPEDLQIITTKGKEYLYVATTTTNEVYRLDLSLKSIQVYANTSTIDLATGAAVGSAAFTNPDNLAVDHEGNLYIVEDRNGGVDDDIWFANDSNQDGDLLDAGEGIGRWASNGTVGSEFTGLYFDPYNSDRAWVNIQHPASGDDRTIEITIADLEDEDDEDEDEGER